MNTELIIVAIISGGFTLAGISLLNHNWFKREDAKYKYYLKRQKQGQKLKNNPIPPPGNPPQTPLTGVGNILNLVKNLDSDQIEMLKDVVLGGGEPQSELGELGGLLENPVIQNAIKGFLEAKTKDGEKEQDYQV